MQQSNYFKSLILRDEKNSLSTVSDRLKAAFSLGETTFKRSDFKIVDILGRYSYGYVAVYLFVRSDDSVCVGNQVKRDN